MAIAFPALPNRWFGPHVAQLARGLAAFGSAEVLARLVRLGTTIVIARQLSPDIVGEAALALTIFELVRVLERVGTGQKIVTAPAHELAAICNTVQRIYWAWTAILIVAQLGIAFALATIWHYRLAGEMLFALAGVWPFMANGHVQYHLALREQKMGRVARIAAVQTISDQFLTLALLVNWASPWSIVLPKILTAPLWLVLARQAHPWRPDREAGFVPHREILRYGAAILLADSMTALRTQGDNLIVAGLLGARALGTYFFAFNAGLGIATAISNAFGTVALPILSSAASGHERAAALRRTLCLAALTVVPLITVQSLCAPYYVPVVFGEKWRFAAPLISLLCLAALPLLWEQILSAWRRAEGRAGQDAAAWALVCCCTLGGLTVGVLWHGLIGGAAGLLCGQVTACVLNVRLHRPKVQNHSQRRGHGCGKAYGGQEIPG